MNVEEVNIIRLQLLQTGGKGEMQRLGSIAGRVDSVLFLAVEDTVGRGELGGQNKLVTVVALLHPLSEPFFRLPMLVVVCRVKEVAPIIVVEIKDLLRCLLVAFSQKVLPNLVSIGKSWDPLNSPVVTKVHGSKAQRAHSHACRGCKHTVTTQSRLDSISTLQHI